MFEQELENIKKFREEINKLNNNDFIINYLNTEDKNRWNILCACMDWQDIAYDNISSYLNESEDPLYYDFCFKYLQCIDILTETLLQQERILKQKDHKWNPIKDKDKCFENSYYKKQKEQKELEVNGNNYDTFKHIRAIFNAHPVNLNSNNERFYASWPFSSPIHSVKKSDNKDYIMIYLYPLDINKSDEILYLYKHDLKNYLKYLLNHFEDLITYIKEEKEKWIENKKNKIISQTYNIKEEILLLKKESEERGFSICDLERIERIMNFEDKYNEDLMKNYKKEIEQVLLPEIRRNIQNLNYDSEDEHSEILRPKLDYIGQSMNYYNEKLLLETDFILPLIIPEIKEKFGDLMQFKEEDKNNSFITLKAALYFYNKENIKK